MSLGTWRATTRLGLRAHHAQSEPWITLRRDYDASLAILGYETVGELRDYVVRGESELLMRKSLGPLAK